MSTNNSCISAWGIDIWKPYVPSTTTNTNNTSDGINIYPTTTTGQNTYILPNSYPATSDYITFDLQNFNLSKQKLAKENFNSIINYKNPNKDGIFKIGYLYKFKTNVIQYESQFKNNYIKLPYMIKLKREFSSKTEIYDDNLFIDYTDNESNFSETFLCLGSKLEERDDLLAVSKNGKTRIINRSWITRFLVGEKIYQFKWFENPTYANNSTEYEIEYGVNGSFYIFNFPGHSFFEKVL